MIRAYRLYTGPDGNSHVERGSITGDELIDAESVEFKETAARSAFDWHNDPILQHVITLSAFAVLDRRCRNLHHPSRR